MGGGAAQLPLAGCSKAPSASLSLLFVLLSIYVRFADSPNINALCAPVGSVSSHVLFIHSFRKKLCLSHILPILSDCFNFKKKPYISREAELFIYIQAILLHGFQLKLLLNQNGIITIGVFGIAIIGSALSPDLICLKNGTFLRNA